MYEDDDLWPIKCPHCSYEFTQQIGRIKAGAKVVCPDCKVSLVDHAKQFAMALAKARNGEFNPWGNMIRLQKSK
jgi:hypothetical protein